MAASAARLDEDVHAWERFVRDLAVAAVGLFTAGILFLLAVDPYDSGRTALVPRQGLHDQYPYTANASRARDPRFDAAILGNSHIQPLRPERLDAQTGARFVSLIMPAIYTQDILDVLRWYLVAHAEPPRALVIGLDHFWCMPTMTKNELRFPRWLYAPRFLDYLEGLVRWRSFEAAQARLAHLVTGKKGIRPDGYWYYGPIYAQQGLDRPEKSYAKLAEDKPFPENPQRAFPALERLGSELATVPAATAVVLVRTPAYRTALPRPGTEGDRVDSACAARMEAVAAARPRTVFLDLFRPGPASDDRDNFYDHDHYRDRLAVTIEQTVAEALRRIGLPRAAGT